MTTPTHIATFRNFDISDDTVYLSSCVLRSLLLPLMVGEFFAEVLFAGFDVLQITVPVNERCDGIGGICVFIPSAWPPSAELMRRGVQGRGWQRPQRAPQSRRPR